MAYYRTISSFTQTLKVFQSSSRLVTNFKNNGYRLKYLPSASSNFMTVVANFNSSSIKNDSFTIQDGDDFKKQVLQSDLPVIVDFHATWCGPCKILGPRLESVLNAFRDKVHFAKVDIDENTDLALEYGVNAVPTVIGIKNGKVQDQFIGLLDEDKIKSFISNVIGPQT